MNGAFLRRRELLIGTVAMALASRTARAAEAQPPQPTQLNWGIDYGPATNPQAAHSFDLLVLEPDHARPIAPLRGPMSRLLGYISVGEVERGRPFATALEKAGALQAPNPNWPNARAVDLRHPAWKSLLIDQLIPEVLAKGYDGIFMDTLDTAEAIQRANPIENAGIVEAGVTLLKAMRERFPGMVMMLNRGYALLPAAAPYVDLVLGEAMASRWNFEAKRYEMTTQQDWDWQATHLRAAKQANPALMLATLDYWDPLDRKTVAALYARERAADFAPYVATLALDRLLPEPRG
jgi:uncharacterized protein (TIGR01370 family)